MEKTHSQKVARAFEIICYFLLVPTFISLIYPVFFMIGGIMESSANMIFLGFIPFLIVAPGIVLLVGYIKHSRGRMNEKNLPALWIATAVYNLILLLPCLYFAASLLQTRTEGDGQILFFLVVLTVVLGYIAAVVSSLKAYAFEKRKKYL